MWVFRKHYIKRGSYNSVKKLYITELHNDYLPTQSSMEELLKQRNLLGTLEANFTIEVKPEVAEATTREESMEAYYNDLKAGAPVKCLGRRTRKNVKCAICMRRKKTKIKLRCGHIFHRRCIDEWARWKAVCPTCKDPLDLKPPPKPPPPQTPPNTPPNTPIVAPGREDSSASVLSI